jgi:hypothetical protein
VLERSFNIALEISDTNIVQLSATYGASALTTIF